MQSCTKKDSQSQTQSHSLGNYTFYTGHTTNDVDSLKIIES